ncbi:MAG: head-tail connector protein [Paracoccaceae bacterium]
MILIEETTVPDASLPVAEYKAHLRLGTGFGDDSLQDPVLRSFLRAAMAAIEARTGKVLITRQFSWTLTTWRDPAGQVLPVAPVTAVTGVDLVDRAGSASPLAADTFRLEQDAQRPRLRPTGGALPWVPQGGSAVVYFDAGFGVDWDSIPPDLAQAVLLLAAHYYEYRNETSLSDGCMPFGVSSLIERYKVMRLHAGRIQ